MHVQVVKNSISKEDLRKIAKVQFGDMVKAVVDVEQGIMAIGGELHADEEVVLMENEGSKREHTWGVNLYPDKSGDEFVEFNSMVNIKPALGNRSRDVGDAAIREKVEEIVKKLIVG